LRSSEELDIVLFAGDTQTDHPFGGASLLWCRQSSLIYFNVLEF
jgi:hypothetical protein